MPRCRQKSDEKKVDHRNEAPFPAETKEIIHKATDAAQPLRGVSLFSQIDHEILDPMFAFWAFTLGLLIGSFLNVVIYRLPLGRSIVSPPSACTTCNTPLHWSLNLPVISYLVLGGRCRHCGCSYSIRYAALELLTGAFFLASELKFGFLTADFWKTVILFCFCLVVFFVDYDHWIIPDSVNLMGALVGLAFSFAVDVPQPALLAEFLDSPIPSPVWSLLGALFGLAFFWSIQVIGLMIAKQEAMGGGDVKFAALIGAFLGPAGALWAFLGSFFLGALFAVPLLIAQRGGGGKDPIPFGTFMALAAILVQVFGVEALLAPLEPLLFPGLIDTGSFQP